MTGVRIVVTGGTGFVGTPLVAALADRGDDVVVLTRGAPRTLGPRIKAETWTPLEAGDWFSHIDGADVVVSLAGAGVLDQRWTAERRRELVDSRLVPTRHLVAAMEQAKQRPRIFVSASAVGYYGVARGADELREDEPPGTDFLAELVRDWEAAANKASDLGVAVALPRIGIVLGTEGGALAKMLPAFRAFVGGPAGSGEQYLAWVHLRDAVRALEFAVDGHIRGAYNVSAPSAATMGDLAREIGAILGRPSFFRVPEIALRLALGEASVAVATGQRAVPARLVEAEFTFVFPDLHAALHDLLSR